MEPRKSYSEDEARELTEKIRDEMEERWARGEETTVGPGFRSRQVGRTAVTVGLTVRLSAEELKRLRPLADAAGISPEELLARWARQRLEQEESAGA